MATTFKPGDMTQRGDLDIFLVNANQEPTTAYEISFALYFVDPGPPEVEVLIGSPTRVPSNPTLGEYFAPLMIPPSAVTGTYRIKWTFKQYANSPVQVVAQEFTVNASGEASLTTYAAPVQTMIDELRMQLRDHCLDGDERVTVRYGDTEVTLTLRELWTRLQ